MRQQKNQQNTKRPARSLQPIKKFFFILASKKFREECAVKQQNEKVCIYIYIYEKVFDLFRAENKLTENAQL